jgi:acetolactate synthase-1/2/3 large subunit
LTGLDTLCAALRRHDVTVAFGLPGTQNAELFNTLPEHGIRPVLATTETAAAFMANGYARASGRLGVVVTIPGPGFAFALPGIAEARLDSVPLLHIVGTPAGGAMRFPHQAIDQAAIAGPLVKAVVEVGTPDEIDGAVDRAAATALAGEPGPVLLHVAPAALGGATSRPDAAAPVRVDASPGAPPRGTDELLRRLRSARHPVLFLGGGSLAYAAGVVELAERLKAPTFTTLTARGVLPEDHACALAFDADRGTLHELNALAERSDLILALGCKFSHNGAAGFGLKLPPDRLVLVNTDPDALTAGYPAELTLQGDVGGVLDAVLGGLEGAASSWTDDDLKELRRRIGSAAPPRVPEPVFRGVGGGQATDFFRALRGALPRDATVVTDSGLHQVMTRRYFDVLTPRGLISPSDFQSMGFGVSASLGAALATPGRPVVALVGDGGFQMAAMEMIAASRENIPVVVVVFNDGYLNLIRMQQLRDHGVPSAVSVENPDFEALAGALGVDFALIDGEPARVIGQALATGRPTLVELRLGDSWSIRTLRAKGGARHAVRRTLGGRVIDGLKRMVRRG